MKTNAAKDRKSSDGFSGFYLLQQSRLEEQVQANQRWLGTEDGNRKHGKARIVAVFRFGLNCWDVTRWSSMFGCLLRGHSFAACAASVSGQDRPCSYVTSSLTVKKKDGTLAPGLFGVSLSGLFCLLLRHSVPVPGMVCDLVCACLAKKALIGWVP